MDEGYYRLIMSLVGCAGVYEGPVAVFHRVWLHKEPHWLTAANYLSAPWCYVVAAGATLIAVVILGILDQGRKRAVLRSAETS
ncbi:hypothetical protein D5S17_11380 [Pseudonocardiaceae bacterium YIM PH 21723]|nr:hypothetical protein D5S17_11380 [Pseudonocardiaceae bacterium YIM PH 21723]